MENSSKYQDIVEKIAISTYVLKDRLIDEKSLTLIAEAGIKKIELLEDSQQFDLANITEMRKIKGMCSNVGISIVSYHSHEIKFNGIETEEKRRKIVDTCKRQIDTLQEVGGTIWASHSRLCDNSVLKCHQELARYVEGTMVKLVIENFVPKGMWVQDRMAFLEELDHPHVGLLLDIGHVRNKAGQNPMTIHGGPTKILESCKEKLLHVHLHGFKEGQDHQPPFCPGDQIQWEELILGLLDINYTGYVLFEPAGMPKYSNTLELTSKMVDIIAKMLH